MASPSSTKTTAYALLEFVALAAPLTYAALTAAYSYVALPPIVRHAAPPALMVKQWLQIYQAAPAWVQPVVLAATLANAALAHLARRRGRGGAAPAYLAAAALSAAILPLTFLYFEPGINGALKWKADAVLQREEDEAVVGARGAQGAQGAQRYRRMPPGRGLWRPSAQRHSATAAARRWADETDLRVLVAGWGWRNEMRWVIAAVAAVVSGWATLAT